jgi:hypothetical protein
MPDKHAVAPDSTAVRVALWRALHVEVDAPPHVLDTASASAGGAGLSVASPDMDPQRIRLFLASIVARAVHRGPGRGTGSARRRMSFLAPASTLCSAPEIAANLTLFEVEQPGTQAWKRRRLIALGFGIPAWLRLVPVDFEAGGSWWERLLASGFDANRPAIVASTGVSMYLTRDAIAATLRQVAGLAQGSTFIMSFLLPTELADPEVRPGLEAPGARRWSAVHRLFTRRRCWPWPAKPAFGMLGMCRPRLLVSATLQAEPTAFDRRTTRKSCWWRLLRWSHFRRRTGDHFGGKCSS